MKQESMARRNIRPNATDQEIKRILLHQLDFIDSRIALARTPEEFSTTTIGKVHYFPAESATFMLRVRIKQHKDDVDDLEEIIHDHYTLDGMLRRPEDLKQYVQLN